MRINFSLKSKAFTRLSAGLMALLVSTCGIALAAEETPPPPQPAEAPAATPWQQVAATIGSQAQTLGIAVQTDDGKGTLQLFVQTATAFEDNSRELTPAFSGFLSRIAPLIQEFPDSRVAIIGYGDTPATRYNLVQLGMRIRRLRTQLANEGVPFKQIKAAVKSHDHYAGPAELSPLAPVGKVIEVRVSGR